MVRCAPLLLLLFVLAGCRHMRLVSAEAFESLKTDSLSAPIDTVLNGQLSPFRDSIQRSMGVVIGYSAIPLTKALPEGLLGNYCAEACMRQTTDWCKQQKLPVPDVCVLNHGGLRASLPFGAITLGNVYELMPFDNELIIIEIDQNQLRVLADHIASKGGAPVCGIRMHIYNNKADSILIPSYNQAANRSLRLLTSDYLANGGDGFPISSSGTASYPTGLKVRDILISDIHEHRLKNDSIRAVIDGRIR